jgi:hypothetical protein
MANRNRTAGNNYERETVNILKEILPDDKHVTSRSESRNMDNMGVDVFNPDANYKTLPLVVLHKKVQKGKKNFTKVGEYAIIEIECFYALIKELGYNPFNIQNKVMQQNPNYHNLITEYNARRNKN